MIDVFLKEYIESIELLCVEHNVKILFAFGSIVDGRFIKGESDVDLLVEFDHNDSEAIATSLFIMWCQLQKILSHKVDLINSDKIKGKYFLKYLDLYKEVIYAKNKIDNNG